MVSSLGSIDPLSQIEVTILKHYCQVAILYQLFRNCSLAVYLTQVARQINSKELIAKHPNFNINVLQHESGVKLELTNNWN